MLLKRLNNVTDSILFINEREIRSVSHLAFVLFDIESPLFNLTSNVRNTLLICRSVMVFRMSTVNL
jgi:hypothetical protein